jgi:hypothetical protein
LSRQGPDPQRTVTGALAAAVLAVLVIVGGALAGFALAGLSSSVADRPLVDPVLILTPSPAVLPQSDVSGEDLARLPRYPGSWRTEYQQETQGNSLVTDVGYVTDAELDDVRGFYRRVFREQGWDVAELDFSLTQWLFVVSSGAETAIVALKSHEQTVVIDVELEQPLPAPTTAPASMPIEQPIVPAPPPPLPPGDGDDDDYDD